MNTNCSLVQALGVHSSTIRQHSAVGIRQSAFRREARAMTTERQVAANRLNGLKGGVKTEAGKAVSRFNARKHGIFASLMTEHDASELWNVAEELAEELAPVGSVEEILVEKLAATCLRIQRCARAEQEHYSTWCETKLAGIRASCEKKLDAIRLQDVRLTNQFLRLLREVQRQQEARKNSECRAQNAECGTKNESNSGAGTAQVNLANGSACAPLSVSTNLRKVDRSETNGLDSRLRIVRGTPRTLGNDDTKDGRNEEQKAQEGSETKNEPNPPGMPNDDFRIPSDDLKTKNEPNSVENPGRNERLIRLWSSARRPQFPTLRG